MTKPVKKPLSIAIACLCLGAAPAWADDEEVLGVSLSQSIKYDSNIFRLADDSASTATSEAGQRSDLISLTGLRLSVNKKFPRHQLRLLFAPSWVQYQRFSALNYLGQNMLVDWSGRLGSEGRYGLNLTRNKVATAPEDLVEPAANTATSDALGVDLTLPSGLASWQIVAAARASETHNSAVVEQSGDNTAWSSDVGFRYASNAGNWAALRYRHAQYDYPNLVPSEQADNSFRQGEIEFTSHWQISQPSRLESRLSYLSRSHEHIARRDFKGWVGELKYTWQASAASSVSARAYKSLGALSDASSRYAKTHGVSINPLWKATDKIRVGAQLAWRQRQFSGLSEAERASEFVRLAGLNLRYEPARTWQLDFSLSGEKRRSADRTKQYDDVIAMLSLKWLMH